MNKVQDQTQRLRDRRRAQGLRPVQLWVLDTREAGFAEEYRRQCRLVNATVTLDPDLKEWDAWIDAENHEFNDDFKAGI